MSYLNNYCIEDFPPEETINYIENLELNAVEAWINLCTCRITQAVRHSKNRNPGQGTCEDFLPELPFLLLRYRALTGKDHMLEQLDHTNY